jgi:hypothetical protein
MIGQQEIIWGIVAPPLLMAVGMATTAQQPLLKRTVFMGILLAVIFAICQLGFRGWTMPGKDVQDWPAWIALAGGLITCCSICHHGPWPWRIVMRLIITGLSVWLLLKPQIQSEGTITIVTWIISGAVTWTALMMAWERVHAVISEKIQLTTFVVLSGLTAMSLLLFNCLTHAQYSGILTAALTAALVIAWWRPSWFNAQGMVTVVALILPTLWLLSNRYSNLPNWALPLLALAGLAPLIAMIAPMRNWSEWKRLATTIAVLGILLLPVVAWGVVTSMRATSEPSYGYQSASCSADLRWPSSANHPRIYADVAYTASQPHDNRWQGTYSTRQSSD